MDLDPDQYSEYGSVFEYGYGSGYTGQDGSGQAGAWFDLLELNGINASLPIGKIKYELHHNET